MQFKTLQERDNAHMKRKELKLQCQHMAVSTPSKTSVQEHLSKEFKAEAERVDVRSIFSLKGLSESKISAYIWSEPQAHLKKPETKGQTDVPSERPCALILA